MSSSNTISIDHNKAKLKYLLKKLEQRQLSKEEARELKPLLEEWFEESLQKKNTDLVIKISHLLIGLNGYIHSSSDSIADFVKPVLS